LLLRLLKGRAGRMQVALGGGDAKLRLGRRPPTPGACCDRSLGARKKSESHAVAAGRGRHDHGAVNCATYRAG